MAALCFNLSRLAGAFIILLGCGCASVNQGEFAAHEKYEKTNRAIFASSAKLDNWLFRPVARGYTVVVPSPVRSGVTNFFSNVRDVDSSLNSFLQGEIKRGARDFSRVTINSTLGFVGLFNVASKFGLESSGEDFGQTLARWGYTASTYLYLPILGPSTVRDVPGQIWQRILSANVFFGSFATTARITDSVSSRANVLVQTDARDDIALDAYAFTRNAYYQTRKNQIFNGNPPTEDFFDLLDEDFSDVDEDYSSVSKLDKTEPVF